MIHGILLFQIFKPHRKNAPANFLRRVSGMHPGYMPRWILRDHGSTMMIRAFDSETYRYLLTRQFAIAGIEVERHHECCNLHDFTCVAHV